MRRLDNFLDRHVGTVVVAAEAIERANHKSSGKLSASALGQPLQWQMLKSFGVPQKPIDEYTLRKFKRGKDVEAWFLSTIPGLAPVAEGKQDFVEYRDTVGYMDGWVDTGVWEFSLGEMPLEIKSTSNAKFKRIVAQGPDKSHCLQGGLYAMAKGSEHFALSYIATDDYRVQTFIVDTADYTKEIDAIISRYQAQKALGKVPLFDAPEKWMADPKYNNYPDWSALSQEEIDLKLAEFLVVNPKVA